ncbi:hypothetical protein BDV18DRAFT_157424 [Aspergillus unguis]
MVAFSDDPSSSFSTSIIYHEKTSQIGKRAEITAGPSPSEQDRHDSYFRDDLRFGHVLYRLPRGFMKRNPIPTEPENETSIHESMMPEPEITTPVLKKPSNDTRSTPPANATVTPVVNEWKHEKASIAASSIFSVVALAALIFLGVTLVKKFRRRQRRKREGDDGSLEEKRRKRVNMMFSNCARSYMVEEQKDGKVVRVVCTGQNKPRASLHRASIIDGSIDKIKSAFSIKAEANQHMEELDDSTSTTGRRGSIPKQPVVVSPPLWPFLSRTAVPASRRGSMTPSEINGLPIEMPYTPARSSTLVSPELVADTEADITPCQSYRRSLLRLPSIRQSMSPLVNF